MITARRINEDEYKIYRSIRLASLREAPYAYTSTYEDAMKRSEESWKSQVKGLATSDDACAYIVFDNDKLIGLGAFYRNTNNRIEGELVQLWIDPEYRGGSAAPILLDGMLSWVSTRGIRKIIAKIKKGNARALKFYQKSGFQVMTNNEEEYVLVRDVK